MLYIRDNFEIEMDEKLGFIKKAYNLKNFNDDEIDFKVLYKDFVEYIEKINDHIIEIENKYEKEVKENLEFLFREYKNTMYDLSISNLEKRQKNAYANYIENVSEIEKKEVLNFVGLFEEYCGLRIIEMKVVAGINYLNTKEERVKKVYSNFLLTNKKLTEKIYKNIRTEINEDFLQKFKSEDIEFNKVQLEQYINQNKEINVEILIDELEKNIRKYNDTNRNEVKDECIQKINFILGLKKYLHSKLDDIWNNISNIINEKIVEIDSNYKIYLQQYIHEIKMLQEEIDDKIKFCAEQQEGKLDKLVEKYDIYYNSKKNEYERHLNYLEDKIKEFFQPEYLKKAYLYACELETDILNYKCVDDTTSGMFFGWMNCESLVNKMHNKTKEIIAENYSFLYRLENFDLPYIMNFDHNFNMIINGKDNSEEIKEYVRRIILNLFMAIKPGKINMTFFDTLSSGETFAMFTRMVSNDDRTNRIINGKIWSEQKDMQDKLNVAISHIANVIQRCLQGKYENILQYNKAAKKNAEPYQVLAIMDFPANFNEDMLEKLERILVSGAKCGVYAIIVKNDAEMKKLNDKLLPLANNILKLAKEVTVKNGTVKMTGFEDFTMRIELMPRENYLDKIMHTLKEGIRNADKVEIGYEESVSISPEEHLKDSTMSGIKVPIGVHGVDEIQYLTLGVGVAQHAIVAGQPGAGKSSLLHTIITSALSKYSEEELNIYLVDFKRGVEFKIYANYNLPVFKVIAVESEKEFGYNVLEYLDREQKIRADLFKKNGDVTNITEYRNKTNMKLPRILVIIDEFHELFSDENDNLSKKAAVYLERIVRQGRAFGIHLILSSQSMSNISGINKSVLDQMTVRIVLKCSNTDASMLLEDGAEIIKQISVDDPGKAIYNSEGGNKAVNTEFRVSYLQLENHKKILNKLSGYSKNSNITTRILLSNVEDNPNNIFNCFERKTISPISDSLYLGESVSLVNNLDVKFDKRPASNLLIVGNDTEKSRNMFVFSILSICVNLWLKNDRKPPSSPCIYLMNYKPLEDDYFKDMLELEGEFLKNYIVYSSFENSYNSMESLYQEMNNHENLGKSKYLMVYGLQNANDMKNDNVVLKQQDVLNGFLNFSGEEKISAYQMFRKILISGPEKGIHSIVWHDSYSSLNMNDRTLISYFDMRIASNMLKEEFSQFINENNVEFLSENNAIYYNKVGYNKRFRPYQLPSEEWLTRRCEILQQ